MYLPRALTINVHNTSAKLAIFVLHVLTWGFVNKYSQ